MEQNLLNIAHLMHGELCNCDDKTCTLEGELYDWLHDGDAASLTEVDVPALVKEWQAIPEPERDEE